MNVRFTLWILFAIFGFSVSTTTAANTSAEEKKVNWRTTQKELTRKLYEENADIAKLATECLSQKPKDGQEAMLKAAVMMRCGMNRQAIEALKELKKMAPGLEGNQVLYAYRDTYGDTPAPEVLKTIFELFHDSVTNYINMHQKLLNSGWTFEQLDIWLAKMPDRPDHLWVKARCYFQIKNRSSDTFIKELTEAARRHPEDIEGVLALLDALDMTRSHGALKRKQLDQVAWIAEKVKPKSALKAKKIADFFKKHRCPAEAIPFYHLAVDIPLTKEETREMVYAISLGSLDAPRLSLSEWRQVYFTIRALEDLIDCMKLHASMQRNIEEQRDAIRKQVAKAVALRKKYHIVSNPELESLKRNLAGKRKAEKQKKKELSKDDPHYWIGRANYYKEQGKPALQEEALRKALALTPLPKEPDLSPQSKDAENFPRVWRLNSYVDFLKKQKRIEDAIEVCRKELRQAPADFQSAKGAANLLTMDLSQNISFDDPVLWDWLARRPKWKYMEERLIREMLSRAKTNEFGKLRGGGYYLNKCIMRAEKLAFKKDPTRAIELGSVCNQVGRSDRAVALLKHGMENTQNQELKERASRELLRAYLTLNDWRHAEEILPRTAKELTSRYLLEKVSRVATVAAKTGAKTDAMRLWKRVANLSPCYTDGLQDLVNTGLKDELQKFYREMRGKLPSPEGIDRVLAKLEGMKP